MALILKMSDLYDKSITDVFWSQIWTIPSIFTVMLAGNLDYTVQNTELRWGQFLGNERLGKHCKFVTISQLDTSMQSKVC